MFRYFINFWIWWYFVRGKALLGSLVNFWMYMLGYLNVVPMLQNLFEPLFQDYTRIGYFVGVPIRMIWVVVGSFLQLIITFPVVIVYLIFLILPLLPVWGVLSFFIRFL